MWRRLKHFRHRRHHRRRTESSSHEAPSAQRPISETGIYDNYADEGDTFYDASSSLEEEEHRLSTQLEALEILREPSKSTATSPIMDAYSENSVLPSERLRSENIPVYPKKLYIRCTDLVHPTRSAEGIDNVIYVNNDYRPHLINNDYFTGHIVLRIKDFGGVTPLRADSSSAPVITNTDYFLDHNRTFSIQVTGRFKHAWTADDVMFGTFFTKPLYPFRGYQLALSIAQKIDPSMVAELERPDPVMCSPLICAMNTFHVNPFWAIKESSDGTNIVEIDQIINHRDVAATLGSNKIKPIPETLPLPQWEWGGERRLPECTITSRLPLMHGRRATINGHFSDFNDTSTIPQTPSNYYHTSRHSHHYPREPVTPPDSVLKDKTVLKGPMTTNAVLAMAKSLDPSSLSLISSAKERRRIFLNPQMRRQFIFHPDTVYSFDFFNYRVDLNRMLLIFGLFRKDVTPYLGRQPVRYQCKSRDGKATFFTIEFGFAETFEQDHTPE